MTAALPISVPPRPDESVESWLEHLADANGLVLETVGDPDFVDRDDRVALSAGASWDENQRGTNAIGTALAEEAPIEILGAEHFLAHNNFLTCCASPIFGPDGRLIGVLDISGDYRSQQHHTLGLARLSSSIIEKRLFESVHARDILVCFHSRPDYLGSPKEGIAAVSPDGQVLALVERLRPDVVLLDVHLPGGGGRAAGRADRPGAAVPSQERRRTHSLPGRRS